MEYHQEQLKKHCSICGKRLNKGQREAHSVYSCSDSSEDLAALVGVENSTSEDDDTSFHIAFLSTLAIPKLIGQRLARKDEVHFYPIAAMEWSPHDVKDCRVKKNNQEIKLKNIIIIQNN